MTRALWITGLPASGKTTLALRICTTLQARGVRATLVDSDEVRTAVTPKPLYTADERITVYRVIAYVASRLADEGIVPVVAATAHEERLRRAAREILPGMFLLYARCPLEECERRDPRGLYARAREGARRPSSTLPGVGVKYEPPNEADLVVDTSTKVPQAIVERIVDEFVGATRHVVHA
jgi:adenylylsulfate kinase